MSDRLFFYRGYLQAGFFIGLLAYVWCLPGHSLSSTGRLDFFADVLGIGSLALGALLRIWAVSHAGRHTRSRKIKGTELVTTGPYAFMRNPIYLANFFIGLGLVVLAEAFFLLPGYLVIFGLPYRHIVRQEESFLRIQFGAEFERYCRIVPRWFPRWRYPAAALVLGPKFHAKELGTTFGVLFGAYFFEWLESPIHRGWIVALSQWFAGRI